MAVGFEPSSGEETQHAAPIPTRARHVGIRPVTMADYDFLFSLAASEETGFRWRFRGGPPRPERFPDDLWSQAFVQFIVEHVKTGRPLGLATAYAANLRDRYCFISFILIPAATGGWALEGAALFVNYLFRHWGFRKLHGEVLEFNLSNFRSGIGRLFEEEGRFRDHEFFDGRYWDVVNITLWRDEWEKKSGHLMSRLLRNHSEAPMP
jgi:RimJ/RimL family protein N-acetyltransferase